jgi:hypothetical protein
MMIHQLNEKVKNILKKIILQFSCVYFQLYVLTLSINILILCLSICLKHILVHIYYLI